MWGAEVRIELKAKPQDMIASLTVLQDKYRTIDSGNQEDIVEEAVGAISDAIAEIREMAPETIQEKTLYLEYPFTQDIVEAEDVELESAMLPFAAALKKGTLLVIMEWEGLDDSHSIQIDGTDGKISTEFEDHNDADYYDDD